MATAQQLFVEHFVNAVNGDANQDVVASSPRPGVLMIEAQDPLDPGALSIKLIQVPTSSTKWALSRKDAGAHAPGVHDAAWLAFSPDLNPDDTVELNIGVSIGGIGNHHDYTYTLPANTAVSGQGIDQTTWVHNQGTPVPLALPGNTPSTPGGNTNASDRQLVVYENNATNPDYGRLIAIDPQDAKGIPIPTFDVQATRPVASALKGQAVYETSTGQGAVWDGAKWANITPRAEVQSWSATQSYAKDELVVYAERLWVSKRGVAIGTKPADPSDDWHLLTGKSGAGISVGGTEPASAIKGQFWYKTTGATPGLRVYDGTKWVEANGVGTFNQGAQDLIPGYFNKTPSNSEAPQDTVGLAASYSGSSVSLYTQKAGQWHAATPRNGVAANEGKAYIADANGNASWSPAPVDYVTTFDSVADHPGGDLASINIQLPASPRKYFKWDACGASNQDGRLMIIMQNSSSWINWGTAITTGQALATYDKGGRRYEVAALKANWFNTDAGAYVVPDDAAFKMKANTVWTSSGKLFLTGDNRTVWEIVTTYTSDNDTPIICTLRVHCTTKNLKAITHFGLKYNNGKGWFNGHYEWY